MSKFKKGWTVRLQDDEHREPFIISKVTDKISRGPMRQLQPSRVYECKDQNGGIWEFREDSLTLVSKPMWPSIGTRSVLIGAHCFFLHPFFVAAAWWKLYGFPWDPRLWVAFFVHDLGYIGKPNMDGPEGELHPYFGAKIMGKLFGKKWHDFTLYHSRFLSKKNGAQYSRLCVADKLAISLTPAWLYLPMVHLTGEIREYMKDAERNSNGTIKVQPSARKWYAGVRQYVYKWVMEHKELKPDTWTTANRDKADVNGVWK